MSNQLSWTIIKHFSIINKYGFTLQDVVREFPEKSPNHLARILTEMVNKRMLSKVSRNNYHIIPINADPETYVPDGHQVAKAIMHIKEYYIGYASAMKIHGLTLQSEAKEYIVTKKQMKPAIRNLGGITYQFIHHDDSRFFGFNSMWINQNEEAMVSDLERTIVDIATKPQYCGGIVELGSAIFQAKTRIDYDKLFYSFARNMNKSAIKRFLFLTELLGLEWTAEHERMMGELGAGISLLDPTAPDQGKQRGEFRLKINVDPIRIKNEILHQKIS